MGQTASARLLLAPSHSPPSADAQANKFLIIDVHGTVNGEFRPRKKVTPGHHVIGFDASFTALLKVGIAGAASGARTHDLLIHNQAF